MAMALKLGINKLKTPILQDLVRDAGLGLTEVSSGDHAVDHILYENV